LSGRVVPDLARQERGSHRGVAGPVEVQVRRRVLVEEARFLAVLLATEPAEHALEHGGRERMERGGAGAHPLADRQRLDPLRHGKDACALVEGGGLPGGRPRTSDERRTGPAVAAAVVARGAPAVAAIGAGAVTRRDRQQAEQGEPEQPAARNARRHARTP